MSDLLTMLYIVARRLRTCKFAVGVRTRSLWAAAGGVSASGGHAHSPLRGTAHRRLPSGIVCAQVQSTTPALKRSPVLLRSSPESMRYASGAGWGHEHEANGDLSFGRWRLDVQKAAGLPRTGRRSVPSATARLARRLAQFLG